MTRTPRVRGTLGEVAAGYIAGLGILLVVDLTGLLTLLGSGTQEAPVLLGLVVGAFLFAGVGLLLRRRSTRLLWPLGIAGVAITGLLAAYNSAYPVAPDADLALRSLLCANLSLVVAFSTGPSASSRTGSVRGFLGSLLILGGIPTLVIAVSAGIYLASDYSGLGETLLAAEGLGALLLVLLALRSRWGRGRPVLVPTGSLVVPPPPRFRLRARVPLRGRALSVALAIFLAGFTVLSTAGPSAAALPPAGGPAPAGAFRTPIRHVVDILMENHAFDNLFGTYPGNSSGALSPGGPNLTVPNGLYSVPTPWPVHPVPEGTYSTPDPVEGYTAYHEDWNGGKMNGFPEGSGPPSMTYYTRSQMAPEWVWAEEYSLADRYFASALSESDPNRLYNLAGASPVLNDYGPPPYLPLSDSIFSELDAYNVSWGYYVQDPAEGLGTLEDFWGIGTVASHIGSFSDFTGELRNGTLPAVTWLMPVDGGAGSLYSQGPPGSVLSGEMWLLHFLDEIMESPAWNSTAIFLTYDEGGGFYDPVPPPVVDGEQLGQRVPMILISPYAKEDYVSHTVLNHASVLAFVDYNWGLPALNPFVASSDLPLDMLYLGTAGNPPGPRPPLPLTAAMGFPVPATVPFPAPPVPGPNLSSLFPQPLQIPPDQLPYPRMGASNTTLASLGAPVYLHQDVAFTPWPVSRPFLGVVGALELVGFLALRRQSRAGGAKEAHGPPSRPAPAGSRVR